MSFSCLFNFPGTKKEAFQYMSRLRTKQSNYTMEKPICRTSPNADKDKIMNAPYTITETLPDGE